MWARFDVYWLKTNRKTSKANIEYLYKLKFFFLLIYILRGYPKYNPENLKFFISFLAFNNWDHVTIRSIKKLEGFSNHSDFSVFDFRSQFDHLNIFYFFVGGCVLN